MSSLQQKKSQGLQRNKKLWSVQRKKITENIHEETCVSDLLDKDFKNNGFKEAQRAKGRCGQARKWSMHNMHNKKEIIFKNSQTEILELRGTTTEVKNSLEGFENRCAQAG